MGGVALSVLSFDAIITHTQAGQPSAALVDGWPPSWCQGLSIGLP